MVGGLYKKWKKNSAVQIEKTVINIFQKKNWEKKAFLLFEIE